MTDAAAANLRSLDMLMGMAEKAKGGKRVIAQVLEALQELFTNVLLPNRCVFLFFCSFINFGDELLDGCLVDIL